MRITTFLAAGLLFLSACTSKKSGEETQQADTTTQSQTSPDASAEVVVSEDLRRLVGEETGLFRGVSLGDNIADVKLKEKIEQFETDASHVGYTFEYPSLESADILYFHDNAGTVNKIDVDLYLNDKESQTRFTKELTAYFTQRFGKVTPKGSDLVWDASPARLVLKDVTKGTNFGLKFTFSKDGGPVTASTK